jgi:hypothetical protein
MLILYVPGGKAFVDKPSACEGTKTDGPATMYLQYPLLILAIFSPKM